MTQAMHASAPGRQDLVREATWGGPSRTTACALGTFGGVAAFRAARQLGHSIAVAEENYLDLVRGTSHEAKTLEAAMQISRDMRTWNPASWS